MLLGGQREHSRRRGKAWKVSCKRQEGPQHGCLQLASSRLQFAEVRYRDKSAARD